VEKSPLKNSVYHINHSGIISTLSGILRPGLAISEQRIDGGSQPGRIERLSQMRAKPGV
jgi:hypothetical protein